MQKDNRRLIDEASEFETLESVKNTFRLGWEFIRLNQTFTLMVLAILIVLNLLGMIPLLSLIAPMLAGVLGMALQIYAGRAIYESKNITDYVELIKNSRINSEALKGHFSTAFGAYMGWVVLLLAFIFITTIMAISSGFITENMSEADLLMALASIGLPLALVALVLSYVQPLVHSNIVLSNGFPEGFKAVFTLFSKDVWSSAMQKSYFTYVSVFGLVIMAILIPFVALFMSVGMGLILNIALIIGSYMLMIIMSIAAMFARRIVEE
jgi:uncharacterized membrane protein YqaE (UPF0057 family)